MNKKTKILITAAALAVIITAAYLAMKLTGTLDKITSAEALKEFILSGGAYSVLIFFVIQAASATFIPLPAFVVTLAGSLVFGPFTAMWISIVGQIAGACIAFLIGRKLGRRVVVWIAGEEDTQKWEKKLVKGKYAFFLMMLFPVFPDDMLCMIAGLTFIPFRFFLITNLITRPIAIATTCYFGAGYIIPFHGYWLILWAALAAGAIALMILSFKHQERIEAFFAKLLKKKLK